MRRTRRSTRSAKDDRRRDRQALNDVPIIRLTDTEYGREDPAGMRIAARHAEIGVAVELINLLRADDMQVESLLPDAGGLQKLRPSLEGAIMGSAEAGEIQRDIQPAMLVRQ